MSEQQQLTVEQHRDKLMNHEYDGIREYDNPLPFWWVGIFIVCIIFAACYWVYYQMSGRTISAEHEEYATELAAWKKLRETILAKSIKVTPQFLAKLAASKSDMAKIKPKFIDKCKACHLPDGGGLVGPNLTDDYQLHGTDRMGLFKTIRDGKPAKGMQSWSPVFKPLDVARLAAYVANLRGTKPAKGKAPQGEKIGPYPRRAKRQPPRRAKRQPPRRAKRQPPRRAKRQPPLLRRRAPPRRPLLLPPRRVNSLAHPSQQL